MVQRMLRIASRHASHFAPKEVIADSIPVFARLLGEDAVSTKESVLRQFSHDEGHFNPKLPEVVLSPKSAKEVSAVVRVCNEKKIPVIPYGTGTGLEGGVIHIHPGVTLNLLEMNAITSVNADDFDCSVQPGVTRMKLNDSIRDTGLFFPVDPGADASVCGMAATSASGTNAVRYGTMKENVLGLEVVLADGSILNTRGKDRRPRKSAAGLNLTELFVGSEGILGVITEARVRLHARPPALSAAVCSFPSLGQAIQSVIQTMQCSIPIARIEFLDKQQVSASNAYSKLTLEETPTLFLEFHGSSEAEVQAQTEAVGEICSMNGGGSFVFSTLPEEMERLWRARHNAYYAALALRTDAHGFTTDVCVPISRLDQVIIDTRKDLDDHGIVGTLVGHVGDGNFHVIMPVYEDNEAEMKAAWEFSNRLIDRALAAGGTCTGEHGIGMGKRAYLKKEIERKGCEVIGAIKKSLDPNGIMNPGKVI